MGFRIGERDRGRTDVDDDGDAVGQWEVTAEFALHDIEILTLAQGRGWDTIVREGIGGPEPPDGRDGRCCYVAEVRVG